MGYIIYFIFIFSVLFTAWASRPAEDNFPVLAAKKNDNHDLPIGCQRLAECIR